MKNTIANGILTEQINWNTAMTEISDRKNSSELKKLPLKIINSVAFQYFYDLSELKMFIKVEIIE